MCIACALLLWLSHFCFQSSHLQWLSLLLVVRFGPCVVSRPVCSCLGLQLSQTQCFQRCDSTKFQGNFPMFPCVMLVDGVYRQTRCLSIAHYWGCHQTGVCGYLSLSMKQESLWSGADPCWGCLHTARLMAPL